MSQESDDPGVLKKAYRTVSPRYQGHADTEMNTVGWAILVGMLVLLVPLLPFIVIVWAVSKVLDALGR